MNYKYSNKEIEKLTKSIYNKDVVVESLGSYSDQNFLLKDEMGEKFILKISNPEEPFKIVCGQHDAMDFIIDKKIGVDIPATIKTVNDEKIHCLVDLNGNKCALRLISFLNGTLLVNVKDHSLNLMNDFGEVLGKINSVLGNYENPIFRRSIYWDILSTPQIVEITHAIDNAKHKTIVDHFLLQYDEIVVPKSHKLRRGYVYNDPNDHNILVDEEEGCISGVIDFGDMVYSLVISDLVIAISYAIHRKDNPVEIACEILQGFHKEFPLQLEDTEVLFTLIATRLCQSVTNSAYQFKLQPENTYLKVSEKPAWQALEKLVKIDPNFATRKFKEICGFKNMQLGKEKEKILSIRKEKLGKSLSVDFEKPLKIVRGQFQYLYDEIGNPYLDTVNNVCHVGHCHPHVVRASQKQTAMLNTNTRYLHDNIIEYAERLTATLPDPLSVCFFVNSGSEANELALRMAKIYTEAKDMIVVDTAYHGNTNSVIEISPYKFDGPGGKGTADHIHKSLLPNPYRGAYKGYSSETGEKYAQSVQEIINKISKSGNKIAAFIAESVPGVAGQIVFPNDYLKYAYQHVRNSGGICIADEVQIGFGRVGSHMWGFQTQGVTPDIVTMGKPMGNGHPLAALVTTPEIADAFNNGMEYFNTFGGNPVSCAIGLSVLDVIEKEELQKNALETGNYLLGKLNNLKERYNIIGDVRGLGLFIGIELVKDRKTLEPAKEEAYFIAEKMKENRILISVDGPLHNVLKFKPPICFSKENAELYVETLERILNENFK